MKAGDVGHPTIRASIWIQSSGLRTCSETHTLPESRPPEDIVEEPGKYRMHLVGVPALSCSLAGKLPENKAASCSSLNSQG